MLKEGLQAYLVAAARARRNAAGRRPFALPGDAAREQKRSGWATKRATFAHGKSADFVYLRPAAASPLAAVLERKQTPERVLAAIFTLAGAESVREVRVEGSVVYRVSAAEESDDHRRVESAGSRRVSSTPFGWIFEHSPWVAERAFDSRPFAEFGRAARRNDRASGTRDLRREDSRSCRPIRISAHARA